MNSRLTLRADVQRALRELPRRESTVRYQSSAAVRAVVPGRGRLLDLDAALSAGLNRAETRHLEGVERHEHRLPLGARRLVGKDDVDIGVTDVPADDAIVVN